MGTKDKADFTDQLGALLEDRIVHLESKVNALQELVTDQLGALRTIVEKHDQELTQIAPADDDDAIDDALRPGVLFTSAGNGLPVIVDAMAVTHVSAQNGSVPSADPTKKGTLVTTAGVTHLWTAGGTSIQVRETLHDAGVMLGLIAPPEPAEAVPGPAVAA